MGKENKNTFISDISSDMINYIKIILTFTTVVIMFVVLIIFGVYLIQLMFNLSIDLIKPLNFIKKIFIFIFTYLLTPCITLLISSRIYRQWQIGNFMEFRNRLIEEERSFRISSLKLEKRYIRTCNNDQLTDKMLEEFSNEKEYILSQYINEIEALALYLDQSIICKYLTDKYFSSWLLGLLEDKSICDFIQKRREILGDTTFEYTIKMLEKIKKGD